MRNKPYKAINIPFKTEAEYARLLFAAKSDARLPTSFIKAAIKSAIEKREAIEILKITKPHIKKPNTKKVSTS